MGEGGGGDVDWRAAAASVVVGSGPSAARANRRDSSTPRTDAHAVLNRRTSTGQPCSFYVPLSPQASCPCSPCPWRRAARLPGLAIPASATLRTLNLPTLVLYDVDGDLRTDDDQVIVTSSVVFGTSLDLAMSLDGATIDTFELVGEASVTSTTTLAASLPSLSMEEEQDLATYEFSNVVVWVGYLPVVLVPEATVYIGASASVEVGMSLEETASINASANLSYANGAWTTSAELTHDESALLTPHLSGDVRAWVGVRTDLLLYGVAGPQLDPRVFGHGQAATDTDPCWRSPRASNLTQA